MLPKLRSWYRKIESHYDQHELEQGLTRLVIGSSFTLYLFFSYIDNYHVSNNEFIRLWCLSVYAALAALLFLAISKAKTSSPTRRLIGNWLDVVGVTAFLSLTGDIAVVLTGVCLWVTLSLGLTIAKGIVESRGGEPKSQSAKNVGTRFWFDLTPEKHLSINPDIDIENTTATNTNQITIPKPSSPRLNILVCEDGTTNQKIITRLLSLPGHNVSVAESSEDMLDMLVPQHDFDLVITDLNMTGMSGIEALKLYRFTHPTDNKTRFLLFTADVTPETKEEANNAGFADVLTKSIDPSTLFSAIERTLDLAPNTASVWMDKINNVSSPASAEESAQEDNIALDINTLLALEKIAGNDDLFMHRLLKNHLTDTLAMINKISDAIKKRHFGALQDYCHALKGSCLSVGALQLADSIDELGKSNTSTSSLTLLKLMTKVSNDFSRLTLDVEAYLKRATKAASK